MKKVFVVVKTADGKPLVFASKAALNKWVDALPFTPDYHEVNVTKRAYVKKVVS